MRLHTARPLPTQPTSARPGTEAKILVMELRWARGQQLFHPGDARMEANDGGTFRRHEYSSNGKPESCDYHDERLYRELEGLV